MPHATPARRMAGLQGVKRDPDSPASTLLDSQDSVESLDGRTSSGYVPVDLHLHRNGRSDARESSSSTTASIFLSLLLLLLPPPPPPPPPCTSFLHPHSPPLHSLKLASPHASPLTSPPSQPPPLSWVYFFFFFFALKKEGKLLLSIPMLSSPTLLLDISPPLQLLVS